MSAKIRKPQEAEMPYVAPAITESIARLRALRKEMEENFFERAEIIEGLLTGLLARQNVLMVGAPGTAKTMLTQFLAAAIKASGFDILLTKFTTPDEVLGPVDIKALKEGSFKRRMDGYLGTAHIALLDEIWKASSAIANALLRAINEKEMRENGSTIKIPLMLVVGCSNEYPQGDELSAIRDRFNINYETRYIGDDANFKAMLKMASKPKPKATMGLDEVEALQAQAQAVAVPDRIIENLIAIRVELKKAGIVISDRRWRVCMDIIKGHAVLEGRAEANEDDLLFLRNVLWNDPQQKVTVGGIVGKVSNPYAQKALELLDMATDVYRAAVADGGTGVVFEANDKMKKMITDLMELVNTTKAAGKSVSRVEEALDKVKGLRADMAEKFLKL